MKLTGQAYKDFYIWYDKQFIDHHISGRSSFDELPLSMQFGVLVDWFDSVEISINITSDIESGFEFIDYDAHVNILHVDNYKTRKEARMDAIITACEMYNDKIKYDKTIL